MIVKKVKLQTYSKDYHSFVTFIPFQKYILSNKNMFNSLTSFKVFLGAF